MPPDDPQMTPTRLPQGGSVSSSEPKPPSGAPYILLSFDPKRPTRRPTRLSGRGSPPRQQLVEEPWGEKGFSMQVCLLVIVPRCPKTLPRRFQDGPSRRKTEGRSPKTFPKRFQDRLSRLKPKVDCPRLFQEAFNRPK